MCDYIIQKYMCLFCTCLRCTAALYTCDSAYKVFKSSDPKKHSSLELYKSSVNCTMSLGVYIYMI